MKFILIFSNIRYSVIINNGIDNINKNMYDYSYVDTQVSVAVEEFKSSEVEWQEQFYFKGEHVEDIGKKIEKYFNSTLNGKGQFVAEYAVTVGMDPYLAAGVMLQETGCYWNCSKLVKKCNNVGGQKGKPSCNGGSYRKFSTLEDGIKFTINKLNGYYKKGKTTAKQINPHYAESNSWHVNVDKYIKKIKNAKI